ncbi:hypothetical protein [Gilvimarinus algae]|uniref:Uncharacterized protein n=1 Tax=Gilvimarinus algae TaxID=3058037 RepID=A0ABT8TFX3_9GAMM|nr:hypothetical protein [Gilvimarinus sp. SDUM040014]MDO3382018.1 hypothetical protein [Gilvimarinus sp. SDUM040014]
MNAIQFIPALLSAIFLFSVLLAGCGSGSDTTDTHTPPATDNPVDPPPELSGDTPLAPHNDDLTNIATAPPAADERVNIELTDAYQSQVTDLELTEAGFWCHVQRQVDEHTVRLYTTLDWQPGWNQRLQCHIDAQLAFQYQPAEGTVIVDTAMLDSSHVIMLEAVLRESTQPNAIGSWFELRLSTLNTTGQPVHQRWLEDIPRPEELFFYTHIAGDEAPTRRTEESLSHNGKPQLTANSLARLRVHQGTPYLLIHSYGVKVYRLYQDLTVAWSRQVMPAYTWLWAESLANESDMAIREDGTVAVGFELHDQDVAIYNSHFDEKLQDNNQGYDVGIAILSPTGALENTFIAGLQGHRENLGKLFWRADELLLTGSTRYTKEGAAGGTTEWDGYIARIDPTTGTTLHSQLLHVHDEDAMRDALLTDTGRLLIAGESGYRQADTNSQTSYGYGVIYEVTDKGEVQPIIKLDTARNSAITGLRVAGDTLYYRYDFDGFITHTCDHDTTQCWLKSGISNLALD